MKKNNIMESHYTKLFCMLCGYFLLTLVLYTLCNLIRFKNCLGLIQILSIVIPIIVYLINNNQGNQLRNIIITISLYLFLLIIVPFLYGKTYDLTIDGNSYHKTAIAFIKNGWNPLYESSTRFQEKNNKVVKFNKNDRIDLWIEHYPKATWIISASMYNMTGSIESGKSITFIFSIMLLIISFYCLRTIIDKKWSLIISLIILLNPIVISQFFTYYVDSLMAICFTIELLLLFMINPLNKQNKKLWMCIISICTMFTNLKYTGLLCSGIIAAVFYFYWIFKYHTKKDFIKKFNIITILFTITFSIAIFLVGSSSYVKNTIEHRNPLYPIIGKNKVDIITTMQPKSFKDKSMIDKFIISIFSKTENVTYYSGKPSLKLPFIVYKEEINSLLVPDVRIGGFGPLFAFLLIISFIAFIISIVIFIKNNKKNISYVLLPILAIVITMILVGENWWARYVPQLYLIPVGTLILLIYDYKYLRKKKIFNILIFLIIITIFSNTLCFSKTIKELLNSYVQINSDLNEMYNKENVKLRLSSKGLYGYYYNLNDKGINYTIVSDIDKEKIRYKYCWRVEVEADE